MKEEKEKEGVCLPHASEEEVPATLSEQCWGGEEDETTP